MASEVPEYLAGLLRNVRSGRIEIERSYRHMSAIDCICSSNTVSEGLMGQLGLVFVYLSEQVGRVRCVD
jgi:hypothetical protein